MSRVGWGVEHGAASFLSPSPSFSVAPLLAFSLSPSLCLARISLHLYLSRSLTKESYATRAYV